MALVLNVLIVHHVPGLLMMMMMRSRVAGALAHRPASRASFHDSFGSSSFLTVIQVVIIRVRATMMLASSIFIQVNPMTPQTPNPLRTPERLVSARLCTPML
jgi:hypothetical protein